MAKITIANQGAIRNQPVSPALIQAVSTAIDQVYGGGFSAELRSGAQSGTRVTGSRRHTTGVAADFIIRDPAGRVLSGAALAPLAQVWISNYGSIGVNTTPGGMTHLDLVGGPGGPPRRGQEGPLWFYGTAPAGLKQAILSGAKLAPAARGQGAAIRARQTIAAGQQPSWVPPGFSYTPPAAPGSPSGGPNYGYAIDPSGRFTTYQTNAGRTITFAREGNVSPVQPRSIAGRTITAVPAPPSIGGRYVPQPSISGGVAAPVPGAPASVASPSAPTVIAPIYGSDKLVEAAKGGDPFKFGATLMGSMLTAKADIDKGVTTQDAVMKQLGDYFSYVGASDPATKRTIINNFNRNARLRAAVPSAFKPALDKLLAPGSQPATYAPSSSTTMRPPMPQLRPTYAPYASSSPASYSPATPSIGGRYVPPAPPSVGGRYVPPTPAPRPTATTIAGNRYTLI